MCSFVCVNGLVQEPKQSQENQDYMHAYNIYWKNVGSIIILRTFLNASWNVYWLMSER